MPLKYNAKADTEGESFEDIEPAVNGQGLNAMRTSYTQKRVSRVEFVAAPSLHPSF